MKAKTKNERVKLLPLSAMAPAVVGGRRRREEAGGGARRRDAAWSLPCTGQGVLVGTHRVSKCRLWRGLNRGLRQFHGP